MRQYWTPLFEAFNPIRRILFGLNAHDARRNGIDLRRMFAWTATMHKHKYLPFVKNATGYWEKRDCPGDGIYFPGMVEKCECGEMQFIADDPMYYRVDCHPMTEKDLR